MLLEQLQGNSVQRGGGTNHLLKMAAWKSGALDIRLRCCRVVAV